jgi:hypothetical protein
MTTQHIRYGFGAITATVFCLFTSITAAEPTVDVPVGYQPGWYINARRAGPRLDRPVGATLADFTAPAHGFDMGNHGGGAAKGGSYGLAYDAQGLLNVTAAGPQRLGVTVGWGMGEPGPEATCRLSLSLEGQVIAAWQGAILILPDKRTAQGSAQLQPGLHPIAVRMACDRPVGSRVSVAISIKTPSDSDLRPMETADIVHPAPAPPETASEGVPNPNPTTDTASATGPATMIAVRDLFIHERPSKRSSRVTQLRKGQAVQVLGLTPNAGWLQLARGGFARSADLQAQPAKATDPAPPPVQPQEAFAARPQYKAGDCRSYRTPGSGDDQASSYGQVCLQADGHWRVVR